MLKFESDIINFILKYKKILFMGIITIIALAIRLSGIDFISLDMREWLIPWIEQFQSFGGVKALSTQIGDYNLLYQSIIALFSYIRIDCVMLYKLLSIFFDFIIAFIVYYGISFLNGKNSDFKQVLGYAVILLLPTVVLNSAFWGQCDSIYTAFLILTFIYLLKEKYLFSFFLYGIALAFKLQAILILPFLVCYYLYKKRFSFYMFFVFILTFWLSGFLAYINGRNLLSAFKIYFNQTGIYENMYINFPSFWYLFGNDYQTLKVFGIMFTIALCGLGIYFVISGKKVFETKEQILNSLCWFLWTCLLFLPAMHERYSYPLDIFLILLAFMNAKYIKYAVFAVLISCSFYGHYLFKTDDLSWLPFIYILLYLHYTNTIMNDEKIYNCQ